MKKVFIIASISLVLLLPSVSFAAIGFDTSASDSCSSCTSRTTPITLTGPNETLVVYVLQYNTTATDHITGATWNGTSMTKVASSNSSGGVNTIQVLDTFVLGNATADGSSHNLIVSADTTVAVMVITAVAYNGTSATQPDASYSSVALNSAGISAATSTVANNSWMIGGLRASSGTPSAGTNTTQRVDPATNGVGVFESSLNPITPAGSTTLTVNDATSNDMFLSLISIAPASSPASTTTQRRRINTW